MPFVLWVQLLLVMCCSLEESRELSSIKRSRVLCYFIRLLLELVVSLLRFPIRCLAYVRLCEPRHVYEFVNLTQDVTQLLGLWTDEEYDTDAAFTATRDELVQERKHNIHSARIQAQLTSAQADIVRLRRENATLDLRLREFRAERTDLHEEFDLKCQAYDSLNNDAAEERAKLLRLLEVERSLASNCQAELDNVNARIRELVAKLRTKAERLANSQATSKRLADERQLLSTSYAKLQSEVKQSKASLKTAKRVMALELQKLGNRHSLVVHRLVYIALLLHGSCQHLGTRFALALHSKDLLLARWRVLSAQKVEAKRTIVRYVHCNQDLEQEVRMLRAREDERSREALKYRTMYNNSVHARKDASRTFEEYYWHARARYSTTTTRLLTGILALWRMNVILSKRLARSELSVTNLSCDLELASARSNRKTSDAAVQCSPIVPVTPLKLFADTAVQCSPATPPRVFSDTAVQCSPATPPPVLVDAFTQRDPAPPVLVNTAVQMTVQTKEPCSVTPPPPVSLSKPVPPNQANFAFGTVQSNVEDHLDTGLNAPLLLPLPIRDSHSPLGHSLHASETSHNVDIDRTELNERVQRLLEKFSAMDSVHRTYRDLLVQKTRGPPTPVESQSCRESPVPRPSVFDRRRSLATSIHAS